LCFYRTLFSETSFPFHFTACVCCNDELYQTSQAAGLRTVFSLRRFRTASHPKNYSHFDGAAEYDIWVCGAVLLATAGGRNMPTWVVVKLLRGAALPPAAETTANSQVRCLFWYTFSAIDVGLS
jgi:hypothetical protein